MRVSTTGVLRLFTWNDEICIRILGCFFFSKIKLSMAIVTSFATFYPKDSFLDSDTGLDFLIESNGKLD